FQLAALFTLGVWLVHEQLVTGSFTEASLATLLVLSFLLLIVARGAARSVVRTITPPERCLLIGDAATCDRIRRSFAYSPRSVEITSAVTFDCPEAEAEQMAALSTSANLRALVEDQRTDRLVLAPRATDAEEVLM